MKQKVLKSVVSLSLAAMMLTTPMSALASTKARLMKVNGSDVNLRTRGGAIITQLNKGTKVLYWGVKDDEMYKVITTSGKTGYVYRELLDNYGAFRKSQVYKTEGKTKLYKRSGSTFKSNGTLGAGKYVIVYKTSGNWAQIRTMTGKSAFCLKSDLVKAF